MPHLLSAGQQAQKSACEQNQRTIREALIEYKLIYHNYPTGEATQQLQELKDKKLLSTVPVDSEGGQYQIDTTTDPNEVTVTCTVHGMLGQ
jgi:general secretion pathway protein G